MEVLKRSLFNFLWGETYNKNNKNINEWKTKDNRLLEKKEEEIGNAIKCFLKATVTKKDRIQDPCWFWNNIPIKV